MQKTTFLLDIFAEILKQNPNSRLLLVGEGELRSQIEKKVKDLKIEEVIFTGAGRM